MGNLKNGKFKPIFELISGATDKLMQKLAPGVRFKPWFKSLFFAQNWEHAEMLENCLFSILGFIIGYTKRAAVEVISEGVKGWGSSNFRRS